FTAKIRGPRLLCKEGIRTSFDYASIDVLSRDYSAKTRAGLVKNIFQGHSRAAALLERERGGDPGNTASDDDNPVHVVTERAGESGPLHASAQALQPCLQLVCKLSHGRDQHLKIV